MSENPIQELRRIEEEPKKQIDEYRKEFRQLYYQLNPLSYYYYCGWMRVELENLNEQYKIVLANLTEALKNQASNTGGNVRELSVHVPENASSVSEISRTAVWTNVDDMVKKVETLKKLEPSDERLEKIKKLEDKIEAYVSDDF